MMNHRIFKYNNGKADVFADPFEIDYRFQQAAGGEDLEQIDRWMDLPRTEEGLLDQNKINDPGAGKIIMAQYMEALHRIEPIVRKTFNLEPFNPETGEGLTNKEVIEIWDDYQLWQADVKKNTSLPPTSATPTDSVETSSEAAATAS
jgi:hypothetical protein